MFKGKLGQFVRKITGKSQSNASRDRKERENGNIVVLESTSLGFSVVEEKGDQNRILTDQEWERIISNGSFDGFSHSEVYFSFLKGLPNHLRMDVWLMLSCPQSLLEDCEGKYKQFLASPLEENIEHQINVDLKRTFGKLPSYSTFATPILKRILHATCGYKHEYTQGMNYILLYTLIFAAESKNPPSEPLLSTDPNPLETNPSPETPHPTKPPLAIDYPISFECKVFAIFTGILDRMQRIFGHNLSKFTNVMKQLQMLLIEVLPELMFQIAGMGFDVMSLFSQNYFTLMTYSAPPFEMAKMILDLFQLEGHKAIHAILIRMLQLCSTQLMQQTYPQSFQKIIKNDIFDICGQRFIQEKKTAKKIEDFGLSFYEKTEFS